MSILSDGQPHDKECSVCGEKLPATPEYFYRKKKGLTGLRPTCKKCTDRQNSEYAATHKKEIQAYKKQYQVDKKEEIKVQRKLYYEGNKKEVRARNKQYYEGHKEELAIYNKQYQQENPEKVRNIGRRRRARKRNIEGFHTEAELQILYDLQNGLCCYCSKPVKNKLIEPRGTPNVFHEEHIVPITRERATDWIWNIVLSCGDCNSTKRTRIVLLEWQPPNPLPYMKEYLEDAIRRQGYELNTDS
jgi:hypothetical protein